MRARTPAEVALAIERRREAASKKFWTEDLEDRKPPRGPADLFEALGGLQAVHREEMRLELHVWQEEIRAEIRAQSGPDYKPVTER